MPKRIKIAVVGDAAGDITEFLARKDLDIQQIDETQADQVVDEQDIVIYDARASETVGNLCQRLRRLSRQRTLVVTSSYEAAEHILAAGYDDVIIAPYDPRELWLRLRKLLCATERTAMRVGTLVINPAARQVRRWSENLELTRLEFDLLHYLIENAGRAVDYNELLTHVWGCDYTDGNQEMVKACVKRLRRKIELDPTQPRYLVTVRGVGYRWDALPTPVPQQPLAR